jgi:hypothetical protein
VVGAVVREDVVVDNGGEGEVDVSVEEAAAVVGVHD